MPSDPITGTLLGCAVGDALGLPYEGLSRQRGIRLLGEPVRHRFLFGRGMVSDDTEHSCMVAQALCCHPHDPEAFARDLAWRLRWWLLGAPAGIGLATLRAILKLWVGFSPRTSGVFSAGNGPAMRSAILGAAIDDLNTLQRFVRASTRLTHTDPKAYSGAFAVALAAWCARRGIDDAGFFGQYRAITEDAPAGEFFALMTGVEQSLARGESTVDYAVQLGCERGVSGYVFRTVPVALHAWLCHPRDFLAAVGAVIRCGGDTDTTAAITGAIVGSAVGSAGLPEDLARTLWEWPLSVAWMRRLGETLTDAMSSGKAKRPPQVVPLVGLFRNVLFIGVVLGHIVRRLLPPY